MEHINGTPMGAVFAGTNRHSDRKRMSFTRTRS